VDVAATAIVGQGEGEAVHILGHGGGVGGEDLGGLSAAGKLVQAQLATWQLVTVRGRNRADLNVPEIDLILNFGEHVSAGLREGPVQLTRGVKGVREDGARSKGDEAGGQT